MHRRHHSRNRSASRAAIVALLALAGCAPATRPDPPGFLGAVIDRPPPQVRMLAAGPYPSPLSEPTPPLLNDGVATIIVAESLRDALKADARMSLAQASLRAAAATTGATVLWQSADASGAVIVARDPYRSHRGDICRDLQQQAQTATGPKVVQVTLCYADLGNGHVLWLPGTPD